MTISYGDAVHAKLREPRICGPTLGADGYLVNRVIEFSLQGIVFALATGRLAQPKSLTQFVGGQLYQGTTFVRWLKIGCGLGTISGILKFVGFAVLGVPQGWVDEARAWRRKPLGERAQLLATGAIDNSAWALAWQGVRWGVMGLLVKAKIRPHFWSGLSGFFSGVFLMNTVGKVGGSLLTWNREIDNRTELVSPHFMG